MKEVKRQAGIERKNRKSQLYLCMRVGVSVHHSRCVSVLSFIMAVGELALLLPSVTKLMITMSILIMPRQLRAHLQHSSTCNAECTLYQIPLRTKIIATEQLLIQCRDKKLWFYIFKMTAA